MYRIPEFIASHLAARGTSLSGQPLVLGIVQVGSVGRKFSGWPEIGEYLGQKFVPWSSPTIAMINARKANVNPQHIKGLIRSWMKEQENASRLHDLALVLMSSGHYRLPEQIELPVRCLAVEQTSKL